MALRIAHRNLDKILNDVRVACAAQRNQFIENPGGVLQQSCVTLRLTAELVSENTLLGLRGLQRCLWHGNSPVGSGCTALHAEPFNRYYERTLLNFTKRISHC